MGSPGILTSPLSNIAIILLTMQFASRLNWRDPEVIMYMRLAYFSVQVVVLAGAYSLIRFIKNKNDTTRLVYEVPKPASAPPSAKPETITTTVRDYDVDQVQQFIKSLLATIFMLSIMHFQFEFSQPLLLQAILPIKNLLSHKEALIHLWGDAPEGDLARPFAPDNPFASFSTFFGGRKNTKNSSTETATPAVASESDKAHKE